MASETLRPTAWVGTEMHSVRRKQVWMTGFCSHVTILCSASSTAMFHYISAYYFGARMGIF
jgi:hypothetical protein